METTVGCITYYTVSSNIHGNSVTKFNLSTSTQLGCKINVSRGCLTASLAEVDYSLLSSLHSHVNWDSLYVIFTKDLVTTKNRYEQQLKTNKLTPTKFSL